MTTNNETTKLPVEQQATEPAPETEKKSEQATDKATVEKVTVTLKHPVEYLKKTYEKLEFDFSKLKGKDSLAVENELQSLGKTALVPTLSGEYLIRIAARACVEPVGADIFEEMCLRDYNAVRTATRSFLLGLE